MCKYTILSFEDIGAFWICLDIVWIPIDCIWSCQITNLCYSQFHIANLFVEKTRLHFRRIYIWLAWNYVVVNTAAIVQSLTHHLLGAYCRSSRRQLAPLTLWYLAPLTLWYFYLGSITWGSLTSSTWFPLSKPFLSFIIFLELFVWHPMDGALMVLRVSGLSYHHVVDFLLRSCGSRWIIWNGISLISWRFPGFYVLSI